MVLCTIIVWSNKYMLQKNWGFSYLHILTLSNWRFWSFSLSATNFSFSIFILPFLHNFSMFNFEPVILPYSQCSSTIVTVCLSSEKGTFRICLRGQIWFHKPLHPHSEMKLCDLDLRYTRAFFIEILGLSWRNLWKNFVF